MKDVIDTITFLLPRRGCRLTRPPLFQRTDVTGQRTAEAVGGIGGHGVILADLA